MKKMLSIDGGGIRGVGPARFLAALEAKSGKPCSEMFDLIAGTSTGGILAVGLTKPNRGMPAFSAADLVDLYQKQGSTIFSRSPLYELESGGGALKSKYEKTGIESVLNNYFADAKLGDALTPVYVTSFDTQAPGPRPFKSWVDGSVLMKDVARSTSAAPVYFPPHPLGSSLLIDGGVYANNPAMCAWVASSEIFKGDKDVLVVSLGTGNCEKKQDPTNWGLAQWAPCLIDFFMYGNSDSVHEQMSEVAGFSNYFRFQFDLGSVSSAMDDASPKMISDLLALADGMIAKNALAIESLAKDLTEKR